MNEYMKLAIEDAKEGIKNGDGGPFGACIVKNGEVLATGHNTVLKTHDPSAHGEICAIRKACEKIGTHDLSGCELYTTGECCPMCLAACMWANISKIYYGCTLKDNESIGFRDDKFDNAFGGREGVNKICPCEQLDREECLKLFKEYNAMNAERY